MRDDENYSDFISRTRGIALIWVIAFPLAIVLHETSQTQASRFWHWQWSHCIGHHCVSRSNKRATREAIAQDIELPQNEIFVIRYLRLFFIKFDRFIWNFMIMWMGPFFVKAVRWKFIRNARLKELEAKYAPER